MADTSRFGRGAQFGDRISPGGESADAAHCAQCEAMLADALDGTLSAEEQALFEAHMAICPTCEAMLADARRGAAWLEMLRDPRPEPPAELLERILAQTSGLAPAVVTAANGAPADDPVAGAGHSWGLRGGGRGWYDRLRAAVWGSSFAGGVLQPRLAMTAAMAFFSIAVTMNLTGVRLRDVRTADLRPSSLRRTFYRANARVVQYYEGLRVVYELESRVHDIESEPETSSPQAIPTAQPAPAAQPQAAPDDAAPEDRAPDTTRPAGKTSGSSPGPGSSRRESPFPSARMVATGSSRTSRNDDLPKKRSDPRSADPMSRWIYESSKAGVLV